MRAADQRDLERRAARAQQSARENCIKTERNYAAIKLSLSGIAPTCVGSISRGASRSEIERKKEEIRRDAAEIAQGRREIRDDLGQLRTNSDRYGYGWGNDSWNRNDNGWWGWGNGRADNRDRWGRGYGRD